MWTVRRASGRRKKRFGIAPVVTGVSAGSKMKPGSWYWPVKVGATSVPSGPSAASNASITVSAPPSTVPMLRKEL